MRPILSTTAVIVFVSLSCLPAQRLLAQEALPVAGAAIESNKNTSSEPPVAGRAIQESQRRPKSNQLALSSGKSSSRREPQRQVRQSKRVISRREHTPRIQKKVTPTKSIRRPVRSSPKIPSTPQNFPIRRG